MKKYYIKVYQSDTTFIKNVEDDEITSEIQFSSQINGGQGQLRVRVKAPWDNPPTWTNPFNFIRVFCVDKNNPKGRLIYSGFISQREPYVNGTDQGIELTALGLVSVLSLSLYKDGSSFDVTHSNDDPKNVIEDIIDNYQSVYPPSSGTEWVGYDAVTQQGITIRAGSQIDSFSPITYEFKKNNWAQAIKKTVELTDATYYWYIDQGGDVIFTDFSSTPQHTFTVGKDVQELKAPENTEEIINSVTLKYSSGTTAAQEDATSIASYGKREQYAEDTDIGDSATAVLAAQKIRDENKDPKIQVSVVLNSQYDFESIRPGQTCRILNYKKGSVVLGANMTIVAVTYSPEFCTLELGGKRFELDKEIQELANN